MSALWLTYWENDDFSKPLGFYVRRLPSLRTLEYTADSNGQMGIYATVGSVLPRLRRPKHFVDRRYSVLQAVFTFTMGAYIALLTYFASAGMHHKAIQRIFFAVRSILSLLFALY